ncbi:hypothetical protein CHUAL_003565 [Chamberlinius hualienensis]
MPKVQPKPASIFDEAGLTWIIKCYRFYGFYMNASENEKSEDLSQFKASKNRYYNRGQIIMVAALSVIFTICAVGQEIRYTIISNHEMSYVSVMAALFINVICNTVTYALNWATAINTSRFLRRLATKIIDIDFNQMDNERRLISLVKNRCNRMSVVFFTVLHDYWLDAYIYECHASNNL